MSPLAKGLLVALAILAVSAVGAAGIAGWRLIQTLKKSGDIKRD